MVAAVSLQVVDACELAGSLLYHYSHYQRLTIDIWKKCGMFYVKISDSPRGITPAARQKRASNCRRSAQSVFC